VSTTTDLVIGIPGANDLAALAELLDEVLGITFQERESSHYGGTYYLAHPSDSETIRLYRNRDAFDGQPLVGSADDYPSLLRLVYTPRAPEALLRDVQARVHAEAQVLSRR
jgi:hypothetical protein